MKLLRKVLIATLIIAFAGLGMGMGHLTINLIIKNFLEGDSDIKINFLLKKTAKELNKNLPIMIDAQTQLDSTIAMNKQFLYKYTIINQSTEDMNSTAFNKTMQPYLVNFVCTSAGMEVFWKNGVQVIYSYYGKNGKQFTTITIKPSQCKNG